MSQNLLGHLDASCHARNDLYLDGQASTALYASVHHVCASTVEASEPVFRHISRVFGTASSVRIEVFRTASSLCNLVNEVLLHRAYTISSSWLAFSQDVDFLKDIFSKNGYPEDLFNSCLRRFLNYKCGKEIPNSTHAPA